HKENISYFGDGDEAHLVYQFSLPPLILHTIHTGSSRHLQKWADELAPPPEGCSFINFTASHDGIGVRPLEGLLDENEIEQLSAAVRDCGGLISYREEKGGRELPYEYNITWFDAMKEPGKPHDTNRQLLRFLCSQIIMLGLRGVPAIYFHSLTASANDYDSATETGVNRAINRYRWQKEELYSLLDNPETTTARVFSSYTDLLKKRAQFPAFHPDTPQKIIKTADSLFVILRTNEKDRPITCLHNVTGTAQRISLSGLGPALSGRKICLDIISGREMRKTITLEPYQCCWLN
ncbi:MAG: alpha-amylase, partial [Deltaproteobacteria bacterium]|nr:alpha-amylase [Deltaproteobacteria bacterium]